MKKLLDQYLKNLTETAKRGDAREESYYKHLDGLVKQFAEIQNIKQVDVTILPKKTEAGNPDFRIWDGKNHITGYIEAKDPSVTNLDYIESTDQLERYLSTFPNVILTNFYEFRLYRDGQRMAQVMIGRPAVAKKLRTTPPLENLDQFKELFDLFFSFSQPKVRTARSLAIELAKRTRFLRDEVIAVEMEENGSKGHRQILGFYEAFKQYLIATLTEKQFADLYAQTITYGMFAARTRAEQEFNRRLAFDYIPKTIGILRDVFRFISLEEPPKSLQIIVDDIAEILKVADVNKILHEYHRTGKGRDPIIHFYETFLATFDPEIRERRGVYYTPESIVSYIVRSIHAILKSHFGLSDGLASEEVKLLDPAGGTLTFPAEAIRLAADEYKDKYGEGGLNHWINHHLLNNYYAFELMMAPYAVGHLKMGIIFDELGYFMSKEERFKLYLTNTLEIEDIEQISIPGLSSLSEESHLASEVKKEQPVLVILGNPPYRGSSVNPSKVKKFLTKGTPYISGYSWNIKDDCIKKKYSKVIKDRTAEIKTFIGDILMDYFFVDGERLDERNPKMLQDDYVKFLRFAEWKIQNSGKGIVGMVTNHGYLENPTFRGMRQSLMRTFNEIYILDLHGSILKKEKNPSGGKEEGVFDIKPGVAIALFIKNKNTKKSNIYHIEKYGLREQKYDWLDRNDFYDMKYQKVKPESPWYFFVPRNTSSIQQYLDWNSINEILIKNVNGIYTSKDKLAIQFNKTEMWNTVLNFSDLDPEIARKSYKLGDNISDAHIKNAQKEINNDGPDKKNIISLLYRPFDIRSTYYTGKNDGFITRPRTKLMRHMLEKNIAIAISKRVEGKSNWEHIFITELIITNHSVSSKETNYIFPLYSYSNREQNDLFSEYRKMANIPSKFLEKLEYIFSHKLLPEDILYYIYGILFSNTYRETYAEFLQIDFPRIPFTGKYDLFKNLVEMGKKLVELHLLKSTLLERPLVKYHGTGTDDIIKVVNYSPELQRIYINKEKYFDGIEPKVWNYRIGGYPILHQYLNDRKGRIMNDAPRYCRIVTALSKTLEIQKQIDEIYPEVEKKVIQF